LEHNPDIPADSFSGPRNTFWESLFVPGMARRKIAAKPHHAEAPRNDLIVQEKASIQQQASTPTAAESRLAAQSRGQHECSFCGRIPTSMGDKLVRCARCHKARYCNRECQTSDWKKHSKQCVLIDK
jgi:hypothetical protein